MAEDRIEAVERLVRLRDAGALTPAEFEREKAHILSQADLPANPSPAGSAGPAAGPWRVRVLALAGLLVVGAIVAIFLGRNAGGADRPVESSAPGLPARDRSGEAPATPGMPSAEGAGPTEPPVGFVLGNEKVVYGWENWGGGYWGDVNRHECCLIRFQKGESTLLALTEPSARGPRGGIEKQRIIDTLQMRRGAGEEVVDTGCVAEGQQWYFALVDTAAQRGRGIYTDGKRLFSRDFRIDRPESCAPYVD